MYRKEIFKINVKEKKKIKIMIKNELFIK